MSLQANQLAYAIGSISLLEGVSLTLQPGEIIAMVGANGAGKSTLLRLLTGELTPTQGAVLLDGKTLSAWSKRDLARRRGVLPQSSVLAFGFTALEVVLMGRTPHLRGIERAEDYDIAYEALSATQVDHLVERSYMSLSGGEQQRVQLARVLAQIWQATEPRYLLLDEPTNNLDLAHQHSTLEIAAGFARRGVGVLAVLHDLNLAAQYADHIVMLKSGRVLAAGLPNTVLTPTLIDEAFNMAVMIQPHPCLNCPLVIAVPQPREIKESVS
jgi:iron complex transport system ATP-binding protein